MADDRPLPATSASVVAWFCENLAQLSRLAEEGGWEGALRYQQRMICDGDDPVRALRAIGITLDGPLRGEIAGLRALGIRPKEVSGRYGCPRGRCVRKAASGADGRQPLCELFQIPMRFAVFPS